MKEELKEHWHTIENHYRLEERLVELEAINKEHQRINGELREKISNAINKLKHTIHFIGKDKNGIEKEWVYLIDIEKELLEILEGDSNE